MNKKRPTWQEKVKDLFGEINEWGYCDCESCNDKYKKSKTLSKLYSPNKERR